MDVTYTQMTGPIGRRLTIAAALTLVALTVLLTTRATAARAAVVPAACTTTVCHTLNGHDTIADNFGCDHMTVTHFYGAGARNPDRITLSRVTFRNNGTFPFTVQPYLQDVRQQVVRPTAPGGQIVVAAGTTYTWTINKTLYMTFFTELRYTTPFGCGGHSNITWSAGPAL